MEHISKSFEPILENRFIINFIGESLDPTPVYLFKSYHIINEYNKIILTIKMYNSTEYIFNPNDLFKITDVKISYLDPTGWVKNSITFPVKSSNYTTKGSYSSNNLMISEFKFLIESDKIKLIKNTINGDEQGNG